MPSLHGDIPDQHVANRSEIGGDVVNWFLIAVVSSLCFLHVVVIPYCHSPSWHYFVPHVLHSVICACVCMPRLFRALSTSIDSGLFCRSQRLLEWPPKILSSWWFPFRENVKTVHSMSHFLHPPQPSQPPTLHPSPPPTTPLSIPPFQVSLEALRRHQDVTLREALVMASFPLGGYWVTVSFPGVLPCWLKSFLRFLH